MEIIPSFSQFDSENRNLSGLVPFEVLSTYPTGLLTLRYFATDEDGLSYFKDFNIYFAAAPYINSDPGIVYVRT